VGAQKDDAAEGSASAADSPAPSSVSSVPAVTDSIPAASVPAVAHPEPATAQQPDDYTWPYWRRVHGDPSMISTEERRSRGRAARREAPRSTHATFNSRSKRREPVSLLEDIAKKRNPDLAALMFGRMLVSPFAYFRGATLPMASDLSDTPRSGLTAQLCGEAHISNFGIFASYSGGYVFDFANFDETAVGPWEWDLKRLAASIEVAGRDDDYEREARREIVLAAVRSYKEAMQEFAELSIFDVSRAALELGALIPRFRSLLRPDRTPSVWHVTKKKSVHESYSGIRALVQSTDGTPRFTGDPPYVVTALDLGMELESTAELGWLAQTVRSYVGSIQPETTHLLDQYRIVDAARKSVGVSGLALETWIVMLVDVPAGSPILLEVRQAETSSVERFWKKGSFAAHGERVVHGQRLIQALPDVFLGWERGSGEEGPRDTYVRRHRDWEISSDVPGMTPASTELWARMCGRTLAKAHARSGDRVAISSYLGKSDVFDTAILKYAQSCADQNERDYEAFHKAVSRGRLAAQTG
jgi:uncharacterized protein (DUF2252 family)